MTLRLWALLASVSVSACTPGTSWLTAISPHERYGLVAAQSPASGSDLPATASATTSVTLRLDGKDVDVRPDVRSRFDVVGSVTDRAFRATCEIGDPDDPDAYQVTLTLVCLRPFTHPDLASGDLLQAAYQIRRSARGSQVSRQTVFSGPDLPGGFFRVEGDRLSIRLEQRSVFAGLDLATVVSATGLPRS